MADETQKGPRATWGHIAAIILLIGLIVYPLSIGPVIWLDEKGGVPDQVWTAYRSIVWLAVHGPEPVRQIVWDYGCWWTRGTGFGVPEPFLGELVARIIRHRGTVRKYSVTVP